jgi:hypothetical protein
MTSTTLDAPRRPDLDDALLGRFRSRASRYDRENRFFTEDFEELVDAGYLRSAVPTVDLLSAGTLVERVAADWSAGVAHPDWPARTLAAKQVAVESAKRVVERAQEIAGGIAIARGTELERLYGDVRCGWFNGVNGFLTAELIGKTVLGVDPQPRW